MEIQAIILLVVLIAVLIVVVWWKKLTVWGARIGGLIAVAVHAAAGMTGIAMLGAFFVLGTLATSWGKKVKRNIIPEDNNEQRTVWQVIANGGLAGVLGLLASDRTAYEELYILMMAACLSSAMADTLSSELGTLYGKRFYNIHTLMKDRSGENGVVSIEGTLIGLAGSCIIAGIYCLGFSFELSWIIVVAGTVGNIADSLLGATLERKGIIKNDAVNLLNTMIAALTAFLLYNV